jgi:antitoxin component YwqK of YwqJK toxin-antitoxin module
VKKLAILLLAIASCSLVYGEEFKEIAPLEERIMINAQIKPNAVKKVEPKPLMNSAAKIENKQVIGSSENIAKKAEEKTTVMTKDKIDGRVIDLAQKRVIGGVVYANDETTPYTGTFALFLGDFIEYAETFVNGVLDGPKTWYSQNGNIVLQEYYKNNKIEGEQKAYYENGAIKSIVEYKNSKVMGITAYGKDGKILHHDDFKDGNGKWKYYWENGHVLEEGQYKNWVKDGVWKKYRENGELDTVIEYKNGRPVEESWN